MYVPLTRKRVAIVVALLAVMVAGGVAYAAIPANAVAVIHGS